MIGIDEYQIIHIWRLYYIKYIHILTDIRFLDSINEYG